MRMEEFVRLCSYTNSDACTACYGSLGGCSKGVALQPYILRAWSDDRHSHKFWWTAEIQEVGVGGLQSKAWVYD